MDLAEKKNDDYWYLLQTRVFEEKLKGAFELLRGEGIEPILIKGWAAGLFYPEEKKRRYTDIDLCVEPESFERALNLVRSERGSRLGIDLHRGLRNLDVLPWEDLFGNSRVLKMGDGAIRVLRPEDHLRVLAVHWLVDGGENRERLWDIFYLVKNRPEGFDWDRCLNSAGEKRRLWVLCTIEVARKHLGLEVGDLPFAERMPQIPGWMERTLKKEWRSGVPLIPLRYCRGDLPLLFKQIRKRIPPNPIQATVDLEGDFDEKRRFFYQLRNFFRRLIVAGR